MRIWLNSLASLLISVQLLSLTSCTQLPAPAEGLEETHTPSSTPGAVTSQGKHSAPAPAANANTSANADPCQKFTPPVDPPPLWLREHNIVITRVLAECVTIDGHKGYRKDSAFVAMGFPCSGGNGKIDVGGHLYAPKIVSLIMATDCPMQPASPGRVSELVQKVMHLTPEAKLLAYNPFALQYWEVPGLADANVGFTIDLRSVEAKQRLWREFMERKPLPVKLYGRENAWVLGHHFYFVDGELIYGGPNNFRLQVKQVKALSEAEIKEVKQRCEALRPRRNCHLVFN